MLMCAVQQSWPGELLRILSETPALQSAYLVGGCVRDWLLGIPPKDIDIEVFGVDYDTLSKALSRWGRTDLVGRSFGVVKLTLLSGETYDFTIPRRDSKVAAGHKGFEIAFDPTLSPREAAARRDFTINSLMYDPREGKMLDFFGGKADLEAGVLRHTSDAFPEDPLRVLRGMQFAARFDLTPAPETIALCRTVRGAHKELAVERIREEWFKWAEKSVRPSRGLQFLAATGWVEAYPELDQLRAVPQDPEWHPEGDVFVHTCHCCDALVRLEGWLHADTETRIVLSLAVLTHDFGKAVTTRDSVKDGLTRIISPGHEDAGGPLAERFLERIKVPRAVLERVLPLVKNHMAHFHAVTDRAVRRLSKRLQPESIANLIVLMTADSHGRPPRPPVVPSGVNELQRRASELAVEKCPPPPVLLGRHLIQLGLEPSERFGKILHAAYEAQLEGRFNDLAGARAWLVRVWGLTGSEKMETLPIGEGLQRE